MQVTLRQLVDQYKLVGFTALQSKATCTITLAGPNWAILSILRSYPKVPVDVNIHGRPDLLFGPPQQWLAGHDAGVVHEDGDVTDLHSNALCQFENCCPICNVCSEKKYWLKILL